MKYTMILCVVVHVFVGSYLATKVLIGKLLAMRGEGEEVDHHRVG